MPKRRNIIFGLGALAVGSGAVLGSGAVGASAQPGADMRVIAAAELVLRRGAGWDAGRSDMSEESIYDGGFDGSPGDLPVAFVNENENDDLTLEIAKDNDSSTHSWPALLEVTNVGTSSVEIRVDYSVYSDDLADSYDGTDGAGADLDRYDAQSIFQFEDDAGTLISPTPGAADDEGENTLTVSAGETEQLTLVTELSDDQVSAVSNATSVSDPWRSGGDTDGIGFLEEIEVTNVE